MESISGVLSRQVVVINRKSLSADIRMEDARNKKRKRMMGTYR